MIGKEELKSMRFFIVFLTLIVGVFLYAGITGWCFYNPDEVTESSYSGNSSNSHGTRFYHK